MNNAKPDELREDEREADAAPAEDLAVLLERDDALQVHRAGLDDHADDREHERQLVRDELPGGAQRTRSARTCSSSPSRPSARRSPTATTPRARRTRRRRGLARSSRGPAGITTKTRNVDSTTIAGASSKTRRSASAGMMSSFCMNLMPSPMSWYQPWKPPGSIGPSRLCMWLIIFNRNDVAEDERGERHDRAARSPS